MKAPWTVGRWPEGEYFEKPWFAHDRGGWSGRGLPGNSFRTWREAFDYAYFMASLMWVK